MNNLRVTQAGLLLLSCVALFGCQDRGNQALILRRGLSGEPATLDPTASGDTFSGQVLMDLYEGLTAESATGEPVPAAASAWEVENGGLRYTFHIRSDAKWSNGEPLLAKHFVQAWKRVLDPESASSGADDLSVIAGAKRIIARSASVDELSAHAIDDRTLVVDLERPAPFFPGLLSHTSAYPVFSTESSRNREAQKWVSNGAFVLKAWQPGSRILLTKNRQYWNANHVLIIDVEYQFSSDENAQYTRYRAGQLDMTDAVPSNALKTIKETAPTELVIAPYLGTAYYGLNLKSEAFARSRELRKALSMAIDRKKLVLLLGFGQSPAYGLVPPRVWNYEPQTVDWMDLNDADRIAEAKRLYALSGYSRNHPLRVRILINTNSAIKQTAIQISAMWSEALGVESQLDEEEYRVFLESRHDSTRFDVARLAWIADFNDAANFLDILRNNSVNNDESYSDIAYDNMLEQAAASTDMMKRKVLLQTAERQMLAQYPIIPLYHYVSKRLVKPYISGVVPSPLDRVASKDITFNYQR